MQEDFVHEAGAHCGSTALRDLATHYDWALPEPVCFGVGGGLGFSYIRSPEPPTRQFVGRTPWLETAFFEHLGIGYADRSHEDLAAGLATIREAVAADDPVVLLVDIYHLPYFGSDVHFAPHVVLATDVDDEAGEVVIADSEFEEPQRVAFEDLEAAWTSRAGFFDPLSRRTLRVTESFPDRSLPAGLRDGIRRTATGLLDPEDAPHVTTESAGRGPGWEIENGLAGLRSMAEDLPAWAEREDADLCLKFAYQNVEKRGTGGGAFRGLFAPFLAFAIDHLGELDPDDGVRAQSLAESWSEAGRSLKEAGLAENEAERRAAAERAREQLHAVADEEAAFFADLRDRLRR